MLVTKNYLETHITWMITLISLKIQKFCVMKFNWNDFRVFKYHSIILISLLLNAKSLNLILE